MSTHPDPTAPSRGRPPTITPERLADIGIRLGLPNLTMANVAAELAVTQAALYKRVANLEALKRLVAEAVFQRWQIPRASVDAPGGLEAYLMGFVQSLCEVVKAHPGLPPYLLRRTVATAPMLEKIASHQAHVAEVFGLPVDKARAAGHDRVLLHRRRRHDLRDCGRRGGAGDHRVQAGHAGVGDRFAGGIAASVDPRHEWMIVAVHHDASQAWPGSTGRIA